MPNHHVHDESPSWVLVPKHVGAVNEIEALELAPLLGIVRAVSATHAC
jgi:hypothetical protein